MPTSDELLCPFIVLIDSAEQHPFPFTGIHADAAGDNRPLVIRTKWQCLGRHPKSLGDYSIDGFQGRCHVERKSMNDAHGTILGFKSERRDRFECELANLAGIEAALVVVECSLGELIRCAPDTDNKTASENAKTLFRSILAYQQDYRVNWCFTENRHMAEVATFRFLERYWRRQRDAARATARQAARADHQQRELAAMNALASM